MKTRITITKALLLGLMSFIFIAHAKAQTYREGYGTNTPGQLGLQIFEIYEKYVAPCDSTVIQSWGNNNWSEADESSFKLNPAGYVLKLNIYEFGQLLLNVVCTRDANNRLTTAILYINRNGSMVKGFEIDPIYNSASLVAQEIDGSNKGTYTYDASGNMTVKAEQQFDSATSTFVNLQLDSFFYNSSHLMVKDNSYGWNGTAYTLGLVYSETYNANGKISIEKDSAPGQTSNYELTNYTYNAAGNEILELDGQVDNGTTQYYGKDTLTYNSKGALLFTTSYQINSNGVWVPQQRSGCADVFSGIAPINNALAFSVYPNPSRGNINIQYSGSNDETADIRIVNMQGKEVYNQQMQFSAYGPTTIQTSSLPDGIYFITAENNTGVHTQKLVVAK